MKNQIGNVVAAFTEVKGQIREHGTKNINFIRAIYNLMDEVAKLDEAIRPGAVTVGECPEHLRTTDIKLALIYFSECLAGLLMQVIDNGEEVTEGLSYCMYELYQAACQLREMVR